MNWAELNINQKAFVLVGEALLEARTIRREGWRQGCSLSPLLFIIYDEAMVRNSAMNVLQVLE